MAKTTYFTAPHPAVCLTYHEDDELPWENAPWCLNFNDNHLEWLTWDEMEHLSQNIRSALEGYRSKHNAALRREQKQREKYRPAMK